MSQHNHDRAPARASSRSSRLAWPVAFAISLLPLGCGDDSAVDGPTGSSASSATSAGSGGGAACGTALGNVSASATTIRWDDGDPATNLREQTFQITVDGKTFVLNDEPVWEGVRFDLAHPTRILGFSIHWSAIDAGASPELMAGLYGDFGHNGFDYWTPDPLWEGTRCAADRDADGWLTYALPEPVVIDTPGLVYVAHRAEPGAPVFSFDASASPSGSCDLFAECHSSLNLPEALTNTYFNGVSFPFQYDYLVRLHTETISTQDPATTFFEARTFERRSRASFADYDRDGDDDLLTEGPRLFQNDGAGNFTDVTADAGLSGLVGSGGVFGDYDNDGCLDLFLFAESYSEADTLLRSNCDGTFADVTLTSGIVDLQTYEDCEDPANTRSPTPAAAFVDLDQDGFLDLYLPNFICWTNGATYSDEVWRNRGDGTFESWTAQRGFSPLRRASRGANPVDLDSDGDVDILVNNYRLQENFYYENLGDGTFLQNAAARGLSGKQTGPYYGHSIGTAVGDLDNDGDFDVVVGNLAHPRFFDFSDKTQVLLQDGAGNFADIQGDFAKPFGLAGLRYQETHSVPALADFDADGVLDLVISAVYDGRPTDYYRGNGDGTFQLQAYRAGITTTNGWGVALADVDNDGDVDTFVGVPFLNRQPQGHYLQARVVGNVASNRAGLGARVEVDSGGTTRVRYVQGGTGQGNQDSLVLHFGLGQQSSVDEIRVRFIGGGLVTYPGPFPVDQRLWLYEDGTASAGLIQPQ